MHDYVGLWNIMYSSIVPNVYFLWRGALHLRRVNFEIHDINDYFGVQATAPYKL